LYKSEIANHTSDPSDEGTIWFDDSAAEDKVVEFLNREVLGQGNILGAETTRENCSFLDLGMGNGHFLFRLREGEEEESDEEESGEVAGNRAWGGRMLGVDYSQRSVEFATRIAVDKGYDGNAQNGREIEFKWWDIMSQSPTLLGTTGWDVVHDKGTFDAISLSDEKDTSGRRLCEGYKEKVLPLVKEGGILLITSCNWTEEELNGWFEGGQLEIVKKIQYKSFSFGGKKGQTISSVCYRKVGLR
jgi:SAM-dependent methyltransferase